MKELGVNPDKVNVNGGAIDRAPDRHVRGAYHPPCSP